MLHQRFFFRFFLIFIISFLGLFNWSNPALAASVDPFIRRYLDVAQPVEVPFDASGNTHEFTGEDLSVGKSLFDNSCVSCHIGGGTAQYPTVSLSLQDLKGATPPRDNIQNLVAYLRDPVSYDGSDYNFWCRQVSEKWMPQPEVEKLAAFILRAGEKVPNWGAPPTLGE